MKEFRFRIIIVLLALALSLYLLYPTYVDYQNSKEISENLESKRNELLQSSPNLSKAELDLRLASIEDSIKNADPSIEKNRLKRIKLGLDLQGGMRVVLEVNTATLLEKLARNPDETFEQVLAEAREEAILSDESVVEIASRKLQERGIRLSRYFGNVREDDSEIISRLTSQAEDAVTRAMEIIRNRIDQYGVSEPSIQRQGSRRIIVELPGVAREEEAKQLLQGTALLEFRLVREPEFTVDLMQRVDNALAGKDLTEFNGTDTVSADVDTADVSADTTQLASDTSAQEELTEEEWLKEHPFFAIVRIDPQGTNAYVLARDRDRLQRMLNLPEVKRVMPDNVEFLFSAKTFTAEDGSVFHNLFLVNKTPELTGGVITDARANIDPNTSAPIVNMEMNSEGATDWARITGANVQKRCAIVLDGLVFSAPVINQKITGGRSQIAGMENMEEAKLLEIVLKAGALPAPVDIIEERTVGPSLGQDSVENGLMSVIIGYILVGIFMIFYYKKAGGMAAASLTFTILFILGVLAGFSATLTLPGIAGIVLTIGMALDANILIFERIREEIATGKTIKASIDSGFAKAFSAIIDSNITTFFTGIILYQFGTGPIQGFALTLMIGIAASLFSALVIVRLVFDYLVFRGTKISIG
jgi:SecD/SecF fusion protein